MSGDTSNASDADNTAEELRQVGTPFRTGTDWKGNAKGRPKGARNKLSEAFIAALHDDFATHGPAVITKVRDEMPHVYLKVIASLVPKELTVDKSVNALADYSDDELLAIIAATTKLANEVLQ